MSKQETLICGNALILLFQDEYPARQKDHEKSDHTADPQQDFERLHKAGR